MWTKRSLRAKLLTGVVLLTLIPFTISNYLAYQSTSDSVEEQFIELNQNIMEIGNANIKKYLRDLTIMAVSIYSDTTLINYLASQTVTPMMEIYIYEELKELYNSRGEIRGITFTSAINGMSHSKLKQNYMQSIEDNLSDVIKVDSESGLAYNLSRMGSEEVLIVTKSLADPPKTDLLGTMQIYVALDEIKDFLKKMAGSNKDSMQLYLGSENQLLTGVYTENLPSGQRLDLSRVEGNKGYIRHDDGVYVYVRVTYLEMPITLVKFIPNSSINEPAEESLNGSIMIQSIALLLMVILVSLFAYWILNPIKRLIKSISQVESGNFRINLVSGRADEIGVLEHRFTEMIMNLDRLINQEYRNRIELTTARLKMLQAQINPHFLYNTLQYIGTLALKHGVTEINEKLAGFSSILRYSMDIKSERVPLEKEIEHIEHYLSLQLGRFKNRLYYSLSCPDEALSFKVPKMILQPLVENSIKHGIEKGRGSGTIHVAIEMGTRLTIKVIDNGKGFDSKQIEQLTNEAGRC